MQKTITYLTFAAASLVVVFLFITSKTYAQLLMAVGIYPILIYLALKIFPREIKTREKVINLEMPKVSVSVDDKDKRAFLKLIGALGVSFFLFSLFNRRITNLPFVRKVAGTETTGIEDAEGNKIDPAQSHPTDGYRISEVDDNAITFYGFVRKGGAWFIMREDTQTGSFRYVKGNKEFTNNWQNRENLAYDYYSNVF